MKGRRERERNVKGEGREEWRRKGRGGKREEEKYGKVREKRGVENRSGKRTEEEREDKGKG